VKAGRQGHAEYLLGIKPGASRKTTQSHQNEPYTRFKLVIQHGLRSTISQFGSA